MGGYIAMILWLLTISGTLILVLGTYFLAMNYRKGKYRKEYGLISYIGFSMLLLGSILLMEPVFTSLPGNLSNTLPVGIALTLSIIVGKLLLKPVLLKNKA